MFPELPAAQHGERQLRAHSRGRASCRHAQVARRDAVRVHAHPAPKGARERAAKEQVITSLESGGAEGATSLVSRYDLISEQEIAGVDAFLNRKPVGAGQQQCAAQIHRHGKYAHYTAPSTCDEL